MDRYNNKYWVSELSVKAQKELKEFYVELLKDDYSKDYIDSFVSDLINEKLVNIEDVVGVDTLVRLSKYGCMDRLECGVA